jgi:isoquinoline 1-oxidoreductase beta subunit
MSHTTLEVSSNAESKKKKGGVSRRGFLATTGAGIGAGLTLGFVMTDMTELGSAEAATLTKVNTWLVIGSDESITLTIGSSEMGQGSFSGLAQVLAEELVVDYSKITVAQGAPSLTSTAVGTAINTVGSSVMRTNFWKMRDAGALARALLLQAAKNVNGDTNSANYTVANGVITHLGDLKTYSYGSLAAAAALIPVASVTPTLIAESQFKLIGKTVPRFDIPLKVNGSAKYGIDIKLPGMLYAIIKHSPTFGGTLASTPTVPRGMTAVIPTKVWPGTARGNEAAGNVNAVAVVGPNTWDTWQAARQLSVQWAAPANASTLNDADFINTGKALMTSATPYVSGGTNGPGTLYTVEGDATAAGNSITGAAKVVDSVYTLPYVAHACMEVLNCTVDYVAGVRCDIYAPTQSAKSLLALAVNITGLLENQITVHTTYLGGGLGRKAELDFVSQAIQVGMALQKPVKLMWPREEDFSHDQYRPMAVVHAKAGLDASGNVVGWQYRNASPSILGQRGAVLPATGDSQGSEGSNVLPYILGNRSVEWVWHPSPIPVGFWRSVGASINTFVVESFIDELAKAAGQDPYTYRRARLTDPRWIAVLDKAASLSNWTSTPPSGTYRGIAIGTAFNSIVAEVVEINNVTATGLRISKVTVVLDSYLYVNPGQVDSQLVGGVVHGLNAAMYGQQNFVAGAAQNKNFSRNRMIRPNEMPTVTTYVMPNPAAMDRNAKIGGVGELGVPTFAPALANAYAKATGVRKYSLPLFPGATMSD